MRCEACGIEDEDVYRCRSCERFLCEDCDRIHITYALHEGGR